MIAMQLSYKCCFCRLYISGGMIIAFVGMICPFHSFVTVGSSIWTVTENTFSSLFLCLAFIKSGYFMTADDLDKPRCVVRCFFVIVSIHFIKYMSQIIFYENRVSEDLAIIFEGYIYLVCFILSVSIQSGFQNVLLLLNCINIICL